MSSLVFLVAFISCGTGLEILFTSFGDDSTCTWPTEWRNLTMPYCLYDYETSINVTTDRQLLWQTYARPFRQCNSQVDAGALAPLDTCTNISPPRYIAGYYKAHLQPAQSPLNQPLAAPITVFYYSSNSCGGAPKKKELLEMHQCRSDNVYPSFAFEYFRKNSTGGDVLVAEYWDSRMSCDGVNRGWAYLPNGQCSQINFDSPYRSWIAFW